ncbi:hypothetical protein [Stenotrophomonas sp. PS02297]|uniref:hypothetical protein n=1 Tax=Stenotrophomonas sp. PS02297 TaxID=2991423 RepID=UPI002499E46C|nr:hypothetical protein [Stenotrophomonas sp. PS02297]
MVEVCRGDWFILLEIIRPSFYALNCDHAYDKGIGSFCMKAKVFFLYFVSLAMFLLGVVAVHEGKWLISTALFSFSVIVAVRAKTDRWYW